MLALAGFLHGITEGGLGILALQLLVNALDGLRPAGYLATTLGLATGLPGTTRATSCCHF